MKNTILRDALRNTPSLNPTLITVHDGTLLVSSYTETTALLFSTPVEGEDLSVTLLPEAVKNLTKMISGKEAELVLRLADDNLYVSVGKKRAVFTTTHDRAVMKAAKMLRDNVLTPSFSVDIEQFSDSLSRTSHYSGDRTIADVRFHGYHLLLSSSSGEIMSSNNKGMSISKFSAGSEKDISLVLPKDILFLTKGLKGNAAVEVREGKMFIDIKSGEYSMRILCALINSTPLPYTGILPKEEEMTNIIRVAKTELADAISEASYFSPDDTYRRVRFTMKDDTLLFNAINSNNGKMEASMPATSEKEDEFEMSYVTLSQAIGNSTNDILIFEVYPKRIVLESGSRNILAKFTV